MKSKYKFFFKKSIDNRKAIIQSFTLLKEVVVHIPVEDHTLKIPASFWKFYFENLDHESKSLLEFVLDTGIGKEIV
jgi:hypothetical protein